MGRGLPSTLDPQVKDKDGPLILHDASYTASSSHQQLTQYAVSMIRLAGDRQVASDGQPRRMDSSPFWLNYRHCIC